MPHIQCSSESLPGNIFTVGSDYQYRDMNLKQMLHDLAAPGILTSCELVPGLQDCYIHCCSLMHESALSHADTQHDTSPALAYAQVGSEHADTCKNHAALATECAAVSAFMNICLR